MNNFKIFVRTEKESIQAQEFLFALGNVWNALEGQS